METVEDRVKSRLATAVFATCVLLVVVVAGRGLAQAWSLAPDLGHGWALPWLLGWLLWERLDGTSPEKTRAAPDWRAWAGLAGGVAVFAGTRLFLEPFPLWPTLLWMQAVLVYGFALAAAGLAGGRSWVRALAGPLALVFTAVPWPTVVENALLHPLREGLAYGVAEVLNFVNVPAFAEGATIRVTGGPVGVDEACGGMRSLQASLMIAWFAGELARMRAGRRVLLLGCAALAAVAGNFLRAAVLTWLTDAGGVELFNSWHDPAGYLALGCTLIVVVVLGWCWRDRTGTRKAGIVDAAAAGKPVLSWAQAAWALVALTVVLGAEAGVRAWFASGQVRLATAPRWAVAWPAGADQFKTYELTSAAKEMLRPDVFTSVSWRTADGGDRAGYYIAWERGSGARNVPFLHSPEVCLPSVGNDLAWRGGPVEVSPGDGLTLPFEVYEFRQHGRLKHVFRVVWDPDEGRAAAPMESDAGLQTWLSRQWADVAGRRIRVRIQVLALAVNGATDRAEAERVFREEIARLVKTNGH
ncbi:MAG: hypothetical protein K0R17_2304 [Rariglobus sp.]|jgi:exosortase|nr:hypothetical protein [Rariglobus sp.]